MGAAVSATPMPSVRICQRGTFASHYLEAWRQGLSIHCETTTHPDRWSRTFTVGALGHGGAWVTIGEQRVDFIYRSLEHLERVIAEAQAGTSLITRSSPPWDSSAARTSARS